MNKADSEKYIFEYENKLNFLEATRGLTDLIEPTLLALPDVQETIKSFCETSTFKTFDKICNHFQSTFNEMKNENIDNYTRVLDSLNHNIGRFFLKDKDMPEDSSTEDKYVSSLLIPSERPNGFSDVIEVSTIIKINPTGFRICTNDGDNTTHLISNLNTSTLSVNKIIAPLDYNNLPIEFVSTTYTLQKDGSITKECDDSREQKESIDKINISLYN